MGYVSKYLGPDRRATVRQATARSVERNGGSAVKRSAARPSGTSPVHRDNHNVIQRKGMKK
jgi:hypothetical protein